MRKRKSKNGFTLSELLIVVAIIAVLVAISIPVFTAQLKKARLAVDDTKIREAYAFMQYAKTTEEITADGTTKSIADWFNSRVYAFYISKDGSLVTDWSKAYLLQESDPNCSQLLPDNTTSTESGLYPTLGHTKDARVYILLTEDGNGNINLDLYTT